MISSLIISALIVVPQVLVVLMAPWAGRSGTKPGPPPASAYRVRRFADPRAVFRFDRRSAASIIVGVQVLDGISATVLGVLTALVTADITARTGRFNLALGIVGTASGIGASISTTLSGLEAERLGPSAVFPV